MIALLKGEVAMIAMETAIIDVGGVGYEINATARLLQSLNAGETISLAIETVVREDFIRLYGFANEGEKQCFRLLQSVQGVGARHALNILQVLAPGELYECIAGQDVTGVTRAHGVGKKIAQRIVTELQSKLGAFAGQMVRAGTNGATPAQGQSNGDAGTGQDTMRIDAVSALVNLGYDSVEARRAVNAVAGDRERLTLEVLIPAALKELG